MIIASDSRVHEPFWLGDKLVPRLPMVLLRVFKDQEHLLRAMSRQCFTHVHVSGGNLPKWGSLLALLCLLLPAWSSVIAATSQLHAAVLLLLIPPVQSNQFPVLGTHNSLRNPIKHQARSARLVIDTPYNTSLAPFAMTETAPAPSRFPKPLRRGAACLNCRRSKQVCRS